MAAVRTESAAPSRRALLAGMLGGLGAIAASAVGRVTTVRANDGDTVTVGSDLSGSTNTNITTTSVSAWSGISSNTGADAIRGVASASTGFAWGVRGVSNSADGSGAVGQAHSSTGNTFGVQGQSVSPDGTGVYGTASSGSGPAIGVKGESVSPGGTGVLAVNGVGGWGLRAIGRTKLQSSGVTTIPGGSTSKTVNPGVEVGNSTFVLLTPKTNIGSRSLWYTTNPNTNRIIIHMSSSRGSGTPVAWLALG